ncbi:MAG: glycosyltransferase family 2 protein [Deltaproteobacteria bacterium]
MSIINWSVAAVVRESPEAVRRFVSWYLALGVREIFLIFENPYDLVIGEIARQPRVHVLRGTANFWQHVSVDPKATARQRQDLALRYAYSICQTPWLFICEMDELLTLKDQKFGAILANQPDEVRAVFVQTAERIFGLRDDPTVYYRLPMPPAEVVKTFNGDLAGILIHTGGRATKVVGRPALRTGINGLKLRDMMPIARNGRAIAVREIGWEVGAVVLNDHAHSFEDWSEKLPGRLDGEIFISPLKHRLAIVSNGDENGLKSIWRDLYQMTAKQRTALIKRGYLLSFGEQSLG